jgi:WD40 repeat protein
MGTNGLDNVLFFFPNDVISIVVEYCEYYNTYGRLIPIISPDFITCMVSLSEKQIVYGNSIGTLVNIDVTNILKDTIRQLIGHTNAITCVAVFSDGKIVTGSRDHSLKIWNTKTYKCIHNIITSSPVSCVIISPDEKFIISSGSEDGWITFWNMRNWNMVQEYLEPEYSYTIREYGCNIKKLLFLPVSKKLVIHSNNALIILNYFAPLWGERPIMKFCCWYRTTTDKNTLNSFDIFPNENILIGTKYGELVILNTNTKCIEYSNKVYDHKNFCAENASIDCVKVISDEQIVAATSNGALALLNIKTKQHKIFMGRHTSKIVAINVFSEYQIISKSDNGEIKVWNLWNRKCTQTIREKNNFLNTNFHKDTHNLIVLPNKTIIFNELTSIANKHYITLISDHII